MVSISCYRLLRVGERLTKNFHIDRFEKIYMETWNIAGQGKFGGYKEIEVAVVKFDATPEESFKNDENYWINIIKYNLSAGMIPMVCQI